MLDESFLDAPDGLTRADAGGLLRSLAQSGARVRTAVRRTREAGVGELRPEGRPRAVLVAGHGPLTACAADLLDALGNGAAHLTSLRPTGALPVPGALRWSLPGWAGAMDLLLVISTEGDEPGLLTLADQAYRRGCTVVSVAPPRTPLAEAVAEARGLAVPLSGPAENADVDSADAPGSLWSVLTPLLALNDRLGLVSAPWSALEDLAGRLDEVAERCGPSVETFGNPAKTLAVELSGAMALFWSEGPVADAAARHAATDLSVRAGRPGLAAALPEALTTHAPLLTGTFTLGGDSAGADFFRDRVDEPDPLRGHVVLLRERRPGADSAVVAVRDFTYERGTPLSELEPSEASGPLTAAAELIATVDFASVYLALPTGDAS